MKNDTVSPITDSTLPRWLWRLTLIGIALVIIIIVSGAILLARGAANPPVAGPVVWEDPNAAWTVTLEAGRGAWWLFMEPESRLPAGDFTAEVQARFSADSDPSAAWGVWILSPDDSTVLYAISGEGYVTTRRCPPNQNPETDIEACPALRPEWRWMPYPRVLPPGQRNTITLHREPSGDIRFRLNGEILGAAPVDRDGAWGVWARGGRDEAALITFEQATLRIRSEKP
jgi:hypothetical protein